MYIYILFPLGRKQLGIDTTAVVLKFRLAAVHTHSTKNVTSIFKKLTQHAPKRLRVITQKITKLNPQTSFKV